MPKPSGESAGPVNLDHVLATVLTALRDDVEPALTTETARGTLRSVRNILAYLIAAASPPLPDSAVEAQAAAALASIPSAPVAADRRKPRVELPGEYYGTTPLYEQIDRVADTLRESGPADREKLASLLAWEARSAARFVARADAVFAELRPAKDDAAASGVDPVSLEAWLRDQYPHRPALRVTGFDRFAGGRSKLTGLARLTGCPELPAEIVLRMDLAVNTTGSPGVAHEYELLRLVHDHGVTVPVPLVCEHDPGKLGTPFLLMTRIEGTVAAGLLRPPRSAAVARGLAVELAKLHRIPIDAVATALPSGAMPDRDAKLAELAAFEERWERHDPLPSLAMRYALRWLRDNIDLAVASDPVVTHGDPLFHNVLADGDRLTALLDWEFTRIGYPAEDLGWIRSVVSGVMPWEDFTDAYRRAGGVVIPDVVIDFYSVWAAVRLAAMLNYSNWLAATGVTDSVEYVCVALHETHIVRDWLSTHVARIVGSDGRRGNTA